MPPEQLTLFNISPGKQAPHVSFVPPPYPVWTEKKAKLIERYLYYFVLITKHGTYIDGFAGPQNPNDSVSWSAKLALENEPRWMRKFYLFDESQSQYDCLIILKDSQPNEPKREIEINCGDFNKLVYDFLKQHPVRDKEATFCLLDQRTFECNWATVKALAKHKKKGLKIELFYFLPIKWLDRAISGLKNKDVKLKDWWGRSDWKTMMGLSPWERAKLFCKRFETELDYHYAFPWAIYDKQGGGSIMYFMIHASDHKEAPKLMRRAYCEVVKSLSPYKQTLLF